MYFDLFKDSRSLEPIKPVPPEIKIDFIILQLLYKYNMKKILIKFCLICSLFLFKNNHKLNAQNLFSEINKSKIIIDDKNYNSLYGNIISRLLFII